MSNGPPAHAHDNLAKIGPIKGLTCVMFFVFAMTSDAVGSIIPALLREYHLSLTAASAFHYVPMVAIALGAISLGYLADRLHRKTIIIVGLALYACSALLFAFGSGFSYFIALLAVSGLSVSIFKTGALASIGDISPSTTAHSSTMNLIEGFFGLGAIVGPTIVALLTANGVSWKWLYVMAAALCAILIALAAGTTYPEPNRTAEPPSLVLTVRILRDPLGLGVSALIMLYVAVEVSIYVWMPTYLVGYQGSLTWLVAYALTIFFVLRAGGRLLGAWLLSKVRWTAALALFGGAIFLCFVGTASFGKDAGVYLLPLSGLFMAVIYPTLNSKGISCFPKAEHGAISGVILFFTAVSAALAPLAMAFVSDSFGNLSYGFVLATGFALLLCIGLILNLVANPARRRLEKFDLESASQFATQGGEAPI
jgi:DHA1 family quinolone resistance protein-like MFS transporter